MYYYKLKQVDFDSGFTFSDIVKIFTIPNAQEQFVIYPNPASKYLNISNIYKVNGIRILDSAGNVVANYQKVHLHEGRITLDHIHSTGHFLVEIIGDNGSISIHKVLIIK